jgi:hypothetical protein
MEEKGVNQAHVGCCYFEDVKRRPESINEDCESIIHPVDWSVAGVLMAAFCRGSRCHQIRTLMGTPRERPNPGMNLI